MSLFKPELPPDPTGKAISQHPWSRIIRDIYANKIKHAHNSVHNPIYPKGKEEKISKNAERIQFTIIGDQITKEYIYCINLVKGLHKYRKKIFDAPIMRGVTTVDWPSVWNELKIRFGGLAFCLRSKVAVLINGKFLGGEKELKELVETKYTYHLCLDYYSESIAEFAKFVSRSGRPFVYMHIAIDDEHVGTLIFMLYADIVPYTCENFLRLCKETRGGYTGTPVHRIVKDGWIQCGGFGLKETALNCENFKIPHDKRGVLCMANDGRHIDCSTQFFVLLQPAPWMAYKYVAFGQLVEGESTLKKIEEVSTWYESPTSAITIYNAGIFNMDCHDIMINRGANEYIHSHIEDLNAFVELLYENLMEKVYLTLQLRELDRLREQAGEGEGSENEGGDEGAGVHATQRFKKEDIEKELQKSKTGAPAEKAQNAKSRTDRPTSPSAHQAENNDFDVEEYEFNYEAEEAYSHQSPPVTPSLVVKPERPYYLALTDVPYPGEIDSNFNLRRFLMGDYCLESDLKKDQERKVVTRDKLSYISDVFNMDEGHSDPTSETSLDSDDEREIQKYLKKQVDSVSFAGGIIRTIAKASERYNLLESSMRSELLTDENLRKLRLASSDIRSRHQKKVSINAPALEEDSEKRVKRRQTGFVRPQDLEKIHVIHKSSTIMSDADDSTTGLESRKVRIAPSTMATQPEGLRLQRRPTGYVRAPSFGGSDSDVRQSVLVRLYEEFQEDSELPTLKDYKPISESQPEKNTLLTFSPTSRIKSEESTREKYIRHSLTIEQDSYEQVMSLQHGKKVTRKISSDYVKTIGQMEHRLESSIRSIEFAKTRPALSVSEYQMKNKKYQEELKCISSLNMKSSAKPTSKNKRGLRLPGDSPLYSMVEIK